MFAFLADLTRIAFQDDLEEGLPQTICNGCADKLVDFHNFRKILVESRHKLLAARMIEPIVKVEHDIAFVSIKSENEEDEIQEYSSGSKKHSMTEGDKSVEDYEERQPRVEAKTFSRTKREAGSAFYMKMTPSILDESKNAVSGTSKQDSTKTASEPKRNKRRSEVSVKEKPTHRQFICEKCEEPFPDRWVFLRHFQNFHLNTGSHKFKCPLCPRLFTGPGEQSFFKIVHCQSV